MTSEAVYGLAKTSVDAHTLGLSVVQNLLVQCGRRVAVAGADVARALEDPLAPRNTLLIESWIRDNRITHLGFSYRLDPVEGAELFGKLVHALKIKNLFADRGGTVHRLYFAGLPRACELVEQEHGDLVVAFCGDETPSETLHKLGVPPEQRPRCVIEGSAYDEARLQFAKELLAREKHLEIRPPDRSGYPEFGTERDTLAARLNHAVSRAQTPLIRAHVGPYLPNRVEAVALFLQWAKELARGGFLDILSIGTSQLTQSNFGEDWNGLPNGGGVPINSPEEFRAVWEASRPMLVRTYAGTKNIPQLAEMYERTINIAWHALSLWWFSELDGRGPYPLLENLNQHFETIRFAAQTGKPFEPNVPHHFAFRGADDVTYVVSAFLAAKVAKILGIKNLVLQIMLNTPKYTWGVQDLAKARALLELVRELEDHQFRVILQPRAGLDYFSPNSDTAKVQLAAATALMDDIQPHSPQSPPVIHVVSYSEASHLANPAVVNESIQITLAALREYRRLRLEGKIDDMESHPEVVRRTRELLQGARAVISAIEGAVAMPYTPEGLYQVFAAGFLPVPYLWECRDKFPHAVGWKTQVINGGVHVVDETGKTIPPQLRAAAAAAVARGG